MRDVHRVLTSWLKSAGCSVSIDAAGNLRALCGDAAGKQRIALGSHLDTVPNAGAFDGILGVVGAVALIEAMDGRDVPLALEVIGFSEEEGVRYGVPFIGSRAVTGLLDDALIAEISPAIREFGLEPMDIPKARLKDAVAYLEMHIEQGPVLDEAGLPIAVVEAIAGQGRFQLRFEGAANHAGTTPMGLRRDALAAAAEWTIFVERHARETRGLVATVGQLNVEPGATNIIPGAVQASLDIRHAKDSIRQSSEQRIIEAAEQIASDRGVRVKTDVRMQQNAVAMDDELTTMLEHSVSRVGCPVRRIVSGAGHDAMIVAKRFPSTMLFVRSPGGISHHPDENVLVEDVEAALAVAFQFITDLESRYA
jgi:allantoate deiminase